MKTLFFVIALGLGCKAEKELKNSDSAAVPAVEDAEVEVPVGVIPAEDCQHISRGDKACNFKILDQNGEIWELYEHSGDVILLDFSTAWCGPCQMAGHFMQTLQNDYASHGVQIVTVLIDGGAYGVPPTQDDVTLWAQQHAITSAPVLQGSRELMYDPAGIEGYVISSYPTYVYIDRNMQFYNAHVGYNDEYVRQVLDEGL